jgi:hypothetical protein
MDCEGPQNRIKQIDEALVKRELGEVVRETVEATLNKLLDAEADELYKADATNPVPIGWIHTPVRTRGIWRPRPVRYG